ncbi:MAG: anti-sigma-factor antagonist [Flaviaesturariibacter sp.]|nr:anti-sigma-factor antagonist [Flaviaesturariibacter sp.]
MEVKTSTKEKFHVITVNTEHLPVNMTEDLCRQLSSFLNQEPRNVVLRLPGVQQIDEEGAECLVRTQQQFYEAGASFVICELEPSLEATLDKQDLLELMNVTPTESEAWDIVQMEEIERELLDDEDEPA